MIDISLRIDEELEWWRPLVQWVLCLPHLAVNGVLTILSGVAWIPMAVAVAVTGRVPRRLAAFQVLVLRERARTFGYLFVLRATMPPFTGDDPVLRFDVDIAARADRWSPVVRPFVVLPHVLVLLPVGLCLDALYPLWMVLVAANRGWPGGMARALGAIERWVVEIILYVTFVTDDAPAFGFDRAEVATA
jgi:hypothetical protein